MTFLLLNQTFYPDVMATGQYLTEVAERLVERGHQVTVVTSRRAYDHPENAVSRDGSLARHPYLPRRLDRFRQRRQVAASSRFRQLYCRLLLAVSTAAAA